MKLLAITICFSLLTCFISSSGDAQLHGIFGYGLLEDEPDIYNSAPYPRHQPPIVPSNLMSPRTPNKSQAVRARRASRLTGPGGPDHPAGPAADQRQASEAGDDKSAVQALALPSPPLIEPRLHMLSRYGILKCMLCVCFFWWRFDL